MIVEDVFSSASSLTFVPDIGATHINLRLTPEQRQMLNDANIVPPYNDMYVIYAHTLTYDRKDMMDRLKSRGSYVGNEDEIALMANHAIDVVQKASTKAKNRYAGVRDAINDLHKFMKHGDRVIVVPIPSSSQTSKIIAQQFVNRFGSTMMDVLGKNRYPPLSLKQIAQRHPDFDLTSIENPAAMKHELHRVETLRNNAASRNDVESFVEWDNRYKFLKQRYAAYSYKRKSYQYPVKGIYIGRDFYDTIIPISDQASALHNAYVLFVDDNIIEGHTIGNTVISLWARGIVPKRVLGFVTHRFKSTTAV